MLGDGVEGVVSSNQWIQLLPIYLVCSFSANLHLLPPITAPISGLRTTEEAEYPASPPTRLSTLPPGSLYDSHHLPGQVPPDF